MTDTDSTKRCCRCGGIKPLDEFQIDYRRSDGGRKGTCRTCLNEQLRGYRAARNEHLAAADGEKPCRRCGITKPRADFPPRRQSEDGRKDDCRACVETMIEELRAASGNPDKPVKRCTVCRKIKPLDDFHAQKDRRDGRQRHCKECSTKVVQEIRQDPAGREHHSLLARDASLRKLYGITLEQYALIFEAQDGRCAICGTAQEDNGRSLDTDHDEASKDVRGLLCKTCNKGIGCFYHDPVILRKAAEYIERTKAEPAVKMA
jgi:hypothetical protein